MTKLISTKVHGVVDYVVAVLWLLVPRLLGLPDAATTLLTVFGIAVVMYSLVTRYEWSIVKWLPMPIHLLIDGVAGVLLLVAAYWFRDAGTATWVTLLVFGLFDLGATLLTDPVSSLDTADAQRAPNARTAAKRTQR